MWDDSIREKVKDGDMWVRPGHTNTRHSGHFKAGTKRMLEDTHTHTHTYFIPSSPTIAFDGY